MRASKGIHLVVPRDRLRSSTGLILRAEIPWGRHWIIGTADTDWSLGNAHPAASSRDIDYLLDHVNAVLATPLCREDVDGVYAGLRPLVSGESDSTAKLSRQHVVNNPVPGLVVFTGGKYTTCRVMAADAVDEATRSFAVRVPPSCTDTIPLLGADGHQALWNQRHDLAASADLHVARIEHLLHRYGSLTAELLRLVDEDRSLASPLRGAEDYLAVEVLYTATWPCTGIPGHRTASRRAWAASSCPGARLRPLAVPDLRHPRHSAARLADTQHEPSRPDHLVLLLVAGKSSEPPICAAITRGGQSLWIVASSTGLAHSGNRLL